MNELKKEFSNIKFVILTDDLEWCREHFEGDEFIFSENNHFTDMAIMSLCDHNIIANSSFSWWGAWLNKNENKIVYAPKIWYPLRS